MDREESVEFARKLVEDIVSFFGENIAVEARIEDDMIALAVESSDLNSILIGHNAETLRSLQYIVMTALHNKGAALTHTTKSNVKRKLPKKRAVGLKKCAAAATRTLRTSMLPTAESCTASLLNIAIFAPIPKAKGAIATS